MLKSHELAVTLNFLLLQRLLRGREYKEYVKCMVKVQITILQCFNN